MGTITERANNHDKMDMQWVNYHTRKIGRWSSKWNICRSYDERHVNIRRSPAAIPHGTLANPTENSGLDNRGSSKERWLNGIKEMRSTFFSIMDLGSFWNGQWSVVVQKWSSFFKVRFCKMKVSSRFWDKRDSIVEQHSQMDKRLLEYHQTSKLVFLLTVLPKTNRFPDWLICNRANSHGGHAILFQHGTNPELITLPTMFRERRSYSIRSILHKWTHGWCSMAEQILAIHGSMRKLIIRMAWKKCEYARCSDRLNIVGNKELSTGKKIGEMHCKASPQLPPDHRNRLETAPQAKSNNVSHPFFGRDNHRE